MASYRMAADPRALAAALGALTAPGLALADCAPDPAMDGDTVICAGEDLDGFSSDADDLEIVISDGAQFSNPEILNADPKIELSSANFELENNAVLDLWFWEDFLLARNGNGTIRNFGKIDGGNPINLADGIYHILNDTESTIGSRGYPSETEAAITVSNAHVSIKNLGFIGSFGSPAIGGRNSTLLLENIGSIAGVSIRDSNVNIENFGTIRGDQNLGLGGIGTGLIENYGSMGSLYIEGIDVKNYGSVGGGWTPSLLQSMTFVNEGTLYDDVVTRLYNVRFENKGRTGGLSISGKTFINNEAGGIIQRLYTFPSSEQPIYINNSGRIENGLSVGQSANVENSGEVSDGMVMAGGKLDNAADGLIEGGVRIAPGDGQAVIENAGEITGETGVGADADDARGHRLVNAGLIRGAGGVAVGLGAGDDHVELLSGGVFEGLVDLGGGADTLWLTGLQAPLVGGPLGAAAPGLGADPFGQGLPFFDGGAGDDAVAFDAALDRDDLLMLAMLPEAGADAWSLAFANADGTESVLAFRSFERFEIGGASLSLDDLLGNGGPTPVPVPAALPLLLGGLGALAALGRRRG